MENEKNNDLVIEINYNFDQPLNAGVNLVFFIIG